MALQGMEESQGLLPSWRQRATNVGIHAGSGDL